MSRSVEPRISRRRFLMSTGGVLAGALSAGLIAGCKKPTVPVRERRRIVIIGSGFGGAVAALRLAEAGKEVLLLERGRRWPVSSAGDTFPSFMKPDRRAAWFMPTTQFPNAPIGFWKPYAGLVEQFQGRGISVVCGAGVGGSSLVFGGMMVKPRTDLFQRVFPREIDAGEMERTWYPRVDSVIGLGEIPDDILAHPRYASIRLFFEQARKAGLTAVKIKSAFDWDIVRAELAGKAPAAASIGEYLYGCNSGAKKSVDRNYLARAERSGFVEVRPLHQVATIAESPGGFVVHCDQIDLEGDVVAKKEIECERLFLAAGSVGSTRLMVQAQAMGTLSRLGDQVGEGWGNNGNRLFLRMIPGPTSAPQGGPACSAILDLDNPLGPVALEHGPAALGMDLGMMSTMGMAIPDAAGRFVHDPADGQVRLEWPAADDEKYARAIRDTIRRLNEAAGAYAAIDLDTVGTHSTYHPLGGMVLGKACDFFGRVRGYQGLYAVDASLIPGSTACANPAWTVAALAERCMDEIVRKDLR